MPRQKMTANHVTDLLAEMVYSNIFKYMPLQKVAEILSKHNLCSQRKRKLPAESIVFLLVLMAINADISISSVLGKMLYPIRLILGVNEETKPPVKSAIVKARKRLTVDFFKELFETICIPQGTRENKYCFFKKYRLVAVDATVQTIQNTPQNAKKFECSTNHCGESHNPKVRITALMECGTKMFFAIKYGSYKEAEVVQYEKLIDSLSSDMLLLADRAYYNFELWQKSLERCGALIWRIKKNVNCPIKKRLSDGSYITEVVPCKDAIRKNPQLKNMKMHIRIVEFRVRFDDGSYGEIIRLATSILDEHEATAQEIAELYPERWLIEEGFSELKVYMENKDNILRSQLPDLVEQEIYAFFLAHYIIRSIMAESAIRNNISPNELSFYASLSILKERVVFFPSNKNFATSEKNV